MRRFFLGCLLLAFSPAGPAVAADVPFGLPLLWPEEQRVFLQDGPGLLLSAAQREELIGLDAVGRADFIARFLADPLPETPVNELAEGIERRRHLAGSEILSFLDARAQLLFLHGEPTQREIVDCQETFTPLEIWTYGTRGLVLYQPAPDSPYRLWLPIDSKRVLYNREMEYWLEQWEELKRRISGGKRFDRSICKVSGRVDEVTGVDGLFGFRDDRPQNADIAAFLEPPADLAAWAKRAAATPVKEGPALLGAGELELDFPRRDGQRLVTRMMVVLPPETVLEPFTADENTPPEMRLNVEGQLEHDGKIFEDFRVRYLLPVPDTPRDRPLALLVERPLRPGEEFLLRLAVRDEVSGHALRLNRGFVVPHETTPVRPDEGENLILALGEAIERQGIAGYDSLLLVPPESDVVFGLWRAEVVITGQRIAKVDFYLDDVKQYSVRRPPFTAEMRLSTYPTEQAIRVEGFDAEGNLVASDQVVVNQPRGELRVNILAPARGQKIDGSFTARAEIVVPEEKKVTALHFAVNETVLATLDKPPWEVTLEPPPQGDLAYLTVTAELNDGSRAEDVRFLNAPDFVEEVDVNLVELFTTVSDKSNRLVRGLGRDDFQVSEDGRPQAIAKFELVEDLPLNLGITIDTSGSMTNSLGQAQRAAIAFLENVITPRDRCFALAFADHPTLLMPRTSDVGAIAEVLEGLVANGATSLHDAVVTSLYYFRGIRGRRALVLLSDGEDTMSSIAFEDALEYARRSGVAIFAIGLKISKLDFGVRRKLESLAAETGGRAFFIEEAVELAGVYDDIENELRSQYLVAYNSDQEGGDGTFREVEVKVKDGKLKARTISGYYP